MPEPEPKAITTGTILVVEDEDRQRDTLVRHLQRNGFAVEGFGDAEAGLEALRDREFHAILSDYRLPGIDGVEFVRRAREIDEEIPAILMTAFASLETAVEALRAGAADYVLKPLFFDELTSKLSRALELRKLRGENSNLRDSLHRRTDPSGFAGHSEAAEKVRTWIDRAANNDATVLITGPTGSGKEVVAHAIHTCGPRAKHPMLTVNVAALAESTIESELFGHVRGAFTGAVKDRAGILRAAGDGTVFLDEIGELSLDLQAKLLRALEAREVQPVGSDRTKPFSARILCATHRDLRRRVADETFREDLFYRLNVLTIDVPKLADRREDIGELAHLLCERIANRKGIATPMIDADAIRALSRYPWPGNVRELANVLERAMILSADEPIYTEHLPDEIVAQGEAPAGAHADGDTTFPDLKSATAAFERRYIAKILRAHGGNRDAAAKALGLSPATLYRRLDKLDLKGDRAEQVEEP